MPQEEQRCLRQDFSSISDAKARELLAQFRGLIKAAVKRTVAVYGRPALLGLDDLMEIGRIALLEAHLTYDAESAAKFSTWAYRLVQWRVCEAMRCAGDTSGDAADIPVMWHLDAPWLAGDDAMLGHEVLADESLAAQDDWADRHRRVAWVRRRLFEAQLDQREFQVLSGILSDENGTAVAGQLGLSRQRVNVHKHAGFVKFQAVTPPWRTVDESAA